ncbi:hypothetical protein ABGV42_00970 [Paenibacillus pabuli]|uniref:hypothetical protein n=1 Tax=Paenibacillus pabuli TaxID=1472 RepID=UPI003242F7AF
MEIIGRRALKALTMALVVIAYVLAYGYLIDPYIQSKAIGFVVLILIGVTIEYFVSGLIKKKWRKKTDG